MYFRPESEKDILDLRWSILKVRNCKVNKDKVIGKIEAKKKLLGPKNLYLFQDQYRDFLVFEPPSIEMLLLIIQAILHYNREAHQSSE